MSEFLRVEETGAVATIWIPPSTMNTPAPIAIARAVTRIDASSHTPNASRLMPAEHLALIRWEICGTYAAPASPAPAKPAISVAGIIPGPMTEAPGHARDLPA